MIYDHERDGAEAGRGRDVADWGGDDLFTSMPRRRDRHAATRARRTAAPATGSHAVRRGPSLDHLRAAPEDATASSANPVAHPADGRFATAERRASQAPDAVSATVTSRGRVAMPQPLVIPDGAPSGRFVRAAATEDAGTQEPGASPDAPAIRRFVREAELDESPVRQPLGFADAGATSLAIGTAEPGSVPAGRRTVTITGRPGMTGAPAPRRRPRPTFDERLAYRPDRIAAWAFLLGLILIFIAVATADAAVL